MLVDELKKWMIVKGGFCYLFVNERLMFYALGKKSG